MQENQTKEITEEGNYTKVEISFSLPFCLYLKDGEYIISDKNCEKITISLKKKVPEGFDSRIGVKPLKSHEIPDDDIVYIGYDENRMHVRVTAHDLKNDKNPYYLYKKDTKFLKEHLCRNYEIEKDKKGFLRFTEVTVTMSIPEENSMNTGYIKKKALTSINRLIEVYRFVTGDYYIERIRESDLIYTHGSINMERYGISGISIYKNFVPFQLDKNPEIHEKIREYLDSGEQIPMVEDLLLNAKDLLLKEDYRLVVLEAVIALEIYLYNFLENKFKKDKKFNNDLINYLLNKPSANKMMKDLFKIATGKKFNEHNNSLWDKWRKVQELRNEITHRKKTKVTDDEANNAVEVIEEIIKYIKDHLE